MDEIGISVCVCTYRRPPLLARLLDGLARQEGLSARFEVVVVDNDREGSAGPVVGEARRRHPGLALATAVEPIQNIARARNRTVRMARGTWLAFIDDDEAPSPRWLAALMRAAAEHSADGVFGPVLPILPAAAPAWVWRGGFFDRPRHATGELVPDAELRTSNGLIRRDLLVPPPPAPARRHLPVVGGGATAATARTGDGAPAIDPAPFDERYGLSGGEDSVLLTALARRGARFVWSDDATVMEMVPHDRTTVAYLLRRSFGAGCGHARLRLEREGMRALPSLLARGGGAVGAGAVLAVASLPLGFDHAVRWSRIGAAGAGKLAAIAGLRYETYRRPSTWIEPLEQAPPAAAAAAR